MPAAFDLLDDAGRFGTDLPRPQEGIRELVNAHRQALAEVERPVPVHFPSLAVLDDRAEDPNFMIDEDFLAGYCEVAGRWYLSTPCGRASPCTVPTSISS